MNLELASINRFYFNQADFLVLEKYVMGLDFRIKFFKRVKDKIVINHF